MNQPNRFAALLHHEALIPPAPFTPKKAQPPAPVQSSAPVQPVPGYVPAEKTLARLQLDNPDLMTFLNLVNPFQLFMQSEHLSPKVLGQQMRKLFPLAAPVRDKLDAEARIIVFDRWTDGIADNIRRHRALLLGPHGHALTDDQLIAVFAKPLAFVAEEVLLGGTPYQGSALAEMVSLRAAHFTDDLNADAKQAIAEHFYYDAQREGEAEEALAFYRKLACRPLDDFVFRKFRSDSFYELTFLLQGAGALLPFLDASPQALLTEADRVMPFLLQTVQEARDDYEEALLLTESPDYALGLSRAVDTVNARVSFARNHLEELQTKLARALKELSTL